MTSRDPTEDPSALDEDLRRLVAAPPIEPEEILRRAAAARVEPGTVLDDTFVIESELGRGGMGVVFLARHEDLGRQVAIKLCARRQSERETARLRREARAIATLAHPNIVVVHHVGTVQGQVYVVMEHVGGGTLRTWLAEKQRPWRSIVDMFVQAARGLQAAHAMELVHRDFKPDNVLVGEDGRARVCDFGLASPLTHDSADKTRSEATPGGSTATGGTPRYMAPEQHAAGPVTPAADQFAWCVALWEALSGEHPFAGDDSTEISCSIVTGRRRTTALPGVPRAIRRALEQGLAADPADRHPSMEALVEQTLARRKRLEVWLGLGVVVGLTAFAVSSSPPDPCATPRIEPPTWSRAQRAALADRMKSSPLRAGQELFARTETAVDSHLQQWRDAEHAACVAAGGEPGRLATAHACLEVDRLRLTETLRQLDRGDPDVLARSLELVHRLGDARQCSDGARATSSDRVAGIETDAREALVRSQTALAAGVLEEAARAAHTVLASTEEDRAVAEAQLVLSRIESKRSDFDASAEHAELALAAAIQGSAADVSARIAGQLVYTEARRGQLGLAERWFGRARAWGYSVGDPASARVLAWSHWGLVLRDARRFEEAERALRGALALLRGGDERSPAKEVQVLDHLGSTLRAQQRYDEAEAILREADAITIAQLGVDHPIRIIVLVSLQVLAKRRGRLEESLALGHEALERVTAWVGADSARAGELHVNLGNVHVIAGDLDEAEAEYAHALALFDENGNDSGQRTLVHNLGQLALQRGDTDTALRWALREVELIEALDLPDEAVVAYSTLSHVQALRGDVDAATIAIQGAIDRMETAYAADDPQRAVPLMTLGRLQLQRTRDAEALVTLERAADLLERSEHGREHVAYDTVQLYRGHALVRLQRHAEALPIVEALVARPLTPGMETAPLQRLLAEARAGSGDHRGAFEALDAAIVALREAAAEAELAEAVEQRAQWERGRWPGQ